MNVRYFLDKNFYRFRKPIMYKSYQWYCQSARKSRQEIIDNQFLELRKLVRYAYRQVPFYTNLWNQCGAPVDLKSPADIEKFPIVEKNQLIASFFDAEKEIISREFLPSIDKLSHHYTSGSTGTPMEIVVDPVSADKALGSKLRLRHWVGADFGDITCTFWRGSLKRAPVKTQLKEFLLGYQHIFCIYDPIHPVESAITPQRIDAFISTLNKRQYLVIEGFPSALFAIAQHMLDEGKKLTYRPLAIVPHAEMLMDEQRAIINEAFKSPVYNRYGSSESSVIAHETKEESHSNHYLHVLEDTHFVEVVDKKNKVIKEGIGDIVVTNFNNLAMPFIRYRNQDRVEVSNSIKSRSSLPFSLFKKIMGRDIDNIVLPNNKGFISAMIWQHYFKPHTYIKNYQVVQEKLDLVQIQVVIDSHRQDEKQYTALQKQVKEALPGITVQWNKVKAIVLQKSGKHRFIVSKVKMAR